MYTAVQSHKSIRDIEKMFPKVIKRHHFGILGIHDIKRNLIEKGVDFKEECLVYEICEPEKTKKALTHNLAIASAIPCRIAVFEKHGHTVLSTINPTALLGQFSYPGLNEMAEGIEKDVIEIMREVANEPMNDDKKEVKCDA